MIIYFQFPNLPSEERYMQIADRRFVRKPWCVLQALLESKYVLAPIFWFAYPSLCYRLRREPRILEYFIRIGRRSIAV